MTMDIAPNGKPGEARVHFRGKPLPNVEILFYSPKVSDEKWQADAEGYVRVPDREKPGPYNGTGPTASFSPFTKNSAMKRPAAKHHACFCWKRRYLRPNHSAKSSHAMENGTIASASPEMPRPILPIRA